MYGVPSAGVLCVELLKATKFPRTSQVKLPRPEVIRKLSIFISCLEWARPTDESYTLCGHMHKIITHIMDQILAPTTVVSTQTVAVEAETTETTDTNISFDLPMQDDTDWLECLNNVDWTNNNWADLG